MSQRIASVQAPIIPILGEWIRSTPGTISLGQGMVGYGPPDEAAAAIPAFLTGPSAHRYGPVEGVPSLVEAIAAKLTAENRFDLSRTRVVVTAGGNLAFVNAVLAIADPGDEVILQAPYYFNHEMAVVLAGCRPVVVPTDASYQLQPDAIAAAITPRTRAVVTVSPNNPSGAVYPEADLRAALTIARQQEAPSLELRAARDLASMLAERGERQQAADLLAPVYDAFTEGFATADLEDAKALLDELRT